MRPTRKMHFAVSTFKYFPILTAAIMLLHVTLLLCGVNSPIANNVAGMSTIGSCVALIASWGFSFCHTHQLLIVYTLVMENCIWYKHYFGMDCMLEPMRWIMFIFGVAVFMDLIINRTLFYKDHGKLF